MMDTLVRKLLEPCFQAMIEDLEDEQPQYDDYLDPRDYAAEENEDE